MDDKVEQHPAVAPTRSGGFVVVWESYDIGQKGDIGAQRFTAKGDPARRELRVSESDRTQEHPAVAADAAGNFVVSWVDRPLDDYVAYRVRSRAFDSKGMPASDEFGASLEGRPSGDVSVTAQPGGGFLVVWAEEGVGVAGQRFHTDGSPRSDPSILAPAGARRPQVASAADGTFLLVWQHYGQDGSGLGVFGRRYSSDGLPVGEEFRANTYTDDHQSLPSVAIDGNGGFVVVWESYASVFDLEGGQDGSGRGVFGQRFDVDGKREGREFQVNTFVAGDQGNKRSRESDVASWPDGTFVATWTSPEQDGSYDGVFAQIFRVDPSLGPLCGDAANNDLVLSVRDALAVLRGAVGLRSCELCLCDTDSSGDVSAADAMSILKVAVKLDAPLECPPCEDG